MRERQFGYDNNIHVASANEEMAYSCYVLNYQSGKFLEAKRFVQKSRSILDKLLGSDHLLVSSAKRVEALIMEEIVRDEQHISDFEPHWGLFNNHTMFVYYYEN